ncbi:hypothetical protein RFI_21365, partial [Reticulomyxa filosa]
MRAKLIRMRKQHEVQVPLFDHASTSTPTNKRRFVSRFSIRSRFCFALFVKKKKKKRERKRKNKGIHTTTLLQMHATYNTRMHVYSARNASDDMLMSVPSTVYSALQAERSDVQNMATESSATATTTTTTTTTAATTDAQGQGNTMTTRSSWRPQTVFSNLRQRTLPMYHFVSRTISSRLDNADTKEEKDKDKDGHQDIDMLDK